MLNYHELSSHRGGAEPNQTTHNFLVGEVPGGIVLAA